MSYLKKIFTFTLTIAISISYGNQYENNILCSTEIPDCTPVVCNPCSCNRTFLTAEFLYWRPFESGLDRCTSDYSSNRVTSSGKVISHFKGKQRDPHFDWAPGFRIGTGYEINENLDVSAIWTHFNSHSSSRHKEDKINWNINYNVIDILGSYNLFFKECFSLIPFAGVRGAQINQKLKIKELANFDLSSRESSSSSFSSSDFTILESRDRENFVGIGPIIGLEADWEIKGGFSLYSSASLSSLYGHFKIDYHDIQKNTDSFNSRKINRHIEACLIGADAGLGIRWQHNFCNNRLLILQLGIEHHRYFDYNRFGNYGDLSFDGLNFSAGVEF